MSKAALLGELHLRIGRTPICPRCEEWNFDDWHLDKSCKSAGGPVVDIYARLKCHGCGIFFSVTQYCDGEIHSWYRSRARQQEPSDAS